MNQTVAFNESDRRSNRFSSRQSIFGAKENREQKSQEDEMFKIIAKIRSLEDDIRTKKQHNTDIEYENAQFIKMIEEMELYFSQQQRDISNLESRVQSERNMIISMDKYEKDLRQVGEEIMQLNRMITEKNTQFEHQMRLNKSFEYQNAKMKEKLNALYYNQNFYNQQIDEIMQGKDNEYQKTFSDDFSRRVKSLIQYANELSLEYERCQESVERIKKETSLALMNEKQKRIKLQYEIKLIEQRIKDSDKEYSLLNDCYNEDRVQKVIDEMLKKQDQLACRISLEEQKINEITQEYKQKMRIQQEQYLEKIKEQESKKHKLEERVEFLDRETSKIQLQLSQISIVLFNQNDINEEPEQFTNRQILEQLLKENQLLELEQKQLADKINQISNQQMIF